MVVNEKILLWLRLNEAKGVGRISIKRLYDRFGSVERIFEADEAELGKVEGIRRGIVKELNNKAHQDFAEAELERCEKAGVRIIALDFPEYPANLRQIPDPPPVLYVKGEFNKDDERSVAVVGSRNHNEYGEFMAKRLGSGLARFGITVVSGMARGIDSLAQASALDAGGRSIAVLGSGLDVVYPPEHKNLYERISENGAVISEFPLGEGPSAENFPRRNRIISGLSMGVVVVQANNPQSGSLITARAALEQGRNVYAVPGNAGSVWAKETNRLIKQGAVLVESAEDIVFDLFPSMGVKVDEMGSLFQSAEKREELSAGLRGKEEELYSLIPEPEEGSVEMDHLIRKSGLAANEAQSILTELELSGLIEKLPGGKWRKRRIAQ